jgi:2-polyprenyl-3-methyl-5-hydroxy-6-metoxy-1,4-benzoquinol methylase
MSRPNALSVRQESKQPRYSRMALSRHARQLFVDNFFLTRTVQRFRPIICPFDELIIRVPLGSRVLDVGCGCGLFLGLLALTNRIVYGRGIDVSPKAARAAQRMSAHLDASFPFVGKLSFECVTSRGSWPKNLFDVVSIIDVLHHVRPEEQESLFIQAAKCLRPGGALIYKDIASRPLWRATANRLHDLVLARQWIHYVPIADIENWAENIELALCESATINRLWYSHELRVFKKRGT